jgi:[acyl-carrier-protein] S-malonyltransferase
MQARRLAQLKGARRIIPLKVSGAFHSSLMLPAIDGLRSAMADFSFSEPKYPLVANVTAQPITHVNAIKEELVNQIIRCVKWQQSVETMISKGVTTFFEIGPADVLTGLIKRISPGAQTFNISSSESIAELESWRKGSL